MLKLVGSEEELRLEVVGYEFPGILDDKWDSNWLSVEGQVSCSRGRWRFLAPCLLTFELESLASWFRALSSGGAVQSPEFIEPNIRFESRDEPSGTVLSVSFSQESSPPWATERERYNTGFTLNFPLRLNDVGSAASAVEAMLAKWPIRRSPETG